MANIPVAELRRFCLELLACHGVRSDVAHHVTEGLLQASLRGVDSHGVRLLPHYLRALVAGRLNPNPDYCFDRTGPATGTLDGDHAFGHAAGAEGMRQAIGLAKESGLGAVAVHNSSHFGAAAYFALMAAHQDLIGLSFTHADSLMLTYGGTRPFFGTNPICFAAPCQDEDPFCLDMATTTVTWNKVLREYSHEGSVPTDWGVDEHGNGAQDPDSMVALHPIGEYKGFGLAMMVDVLCGLLTGMPFGRDISRMYADPIETKRSLGHFFLAISVERFMPLAQFKGRMQQLMDQVRQEPPRYESIPVQVPGDPEKHAGKQRLRTGLELSDGELDELSDSGREYGLSIASVLEADPI